MLASVEALSSRVKGVALKEKATETRVYRTIIMPLPKSDKWSNESSYSQRSPAGRVLECLPTPEGAPSPTRMHCSCCGRPGHGKRLESDAGTIIGLVLFKVDDEEVLSLSSAEESDAFLKAEFPALYPIMPASEIAAFATKPPGKLPMFKYVGPDLHYDDKVVLLGDVVHTVKPYFGLGVNSALDDVLVLRNKLQAHAVCSPELYLRCAMQQQVSQCKLCCSLRRVCRADGPERGFDGVLSGAGSRRTSPG